MSSLSAPEDRWAAGQSELMRRVATLEQQIAQGAGAYAAFVCTSATRPASPRTGQEIYETDTKRFLIWSGSTWEQKAFASFVCTSSTHPSSPFQGQEIYETDTGATGIWSGSAWTFQPTAISPTVLASTSAAITVPIPAGFTALQAVWSARSTQASVVVNMAIRFNGDSGNNYLWQEIQAENASVAGANSGGLLSLIQIGVAPGSTATANYFGAGRFDVPNPGSSVFKPAVGVSYGADSSADQFIGPYGGQWNSTSAISSVSLLATAGSLAAGSSLTVYGYK